MLQDFLTGYSLKQESGRRQMVIFLAEGILLQQKISRYDLAQEQGGG